MKDAAFSLIDYRFDYVKINFEHDEIKESNLEFLTAGEYDDPNSVFKVIFVFKSNLPDIEESNIEMSCISLFKFKEDVKFEDIPDYFYGNAIAIIFPYVRAFVSTVTLQSNNPPLILPTLNLSDLGKQLKEGTIKMRQDG